ncbi:MAG: squalene--hopene cyclase, partial [Myxococcota bacterium]
ARPSSAHRGALMTLMELAPHERGPIDRGVQFLVAQQSDDGAWPPERASGVFFNTAVLDYRLYRQVFPAWALARWQATYCK